MAIIVTPGGTDSNSYATLAEANTFHTERLHNAAWTSASDATKEAAMIWATLLIDSNILWHGIRATEEQALDWPRYGMYDKDGYSVDSDIVPKQVKDAESELAFLLIVEDRTLSNDPKNAGVKKADVGSLSLEMSDVYKKAVLSPSVVTYIQEFGDFAGVGSTSSSGVIYTERV